MLLFDVETEPLPEEQLRAAFVPTTQEEFFASCDQRWKPETKAQKFEELAANEWTKFVDRASLSPLTGRILAIGYAPRGEEPFISCGHEIAVLEEFWDRYRRGPTLAGWNIHDFDVPFIVRRSWYHRVTVPPFHKSNFIDLMQRFSVGVFADKYTSLDTAVRFLQVGQKNGCGKDFAALWHLDRAAAEQYLLNDLFLLSSLASVLVPISEDMLA